MVWRRCQEIDQFRLFVFPNTVSCEGTQEGILFQSWIFSCSHAVFLMNTTEVHWIFIGKTESTSEIGLLGAFVWRLN